MHQEFSIKGQGILQNIDGVNTEHPVENDLGDDKNDKIGSGRSHGRSDDAKEMHADKIGCDIDA